MLMNFQFWNEANKQKIRAHTAISTHSSVPSVINTHRQDAGKFVPASGTRGIQPDSCKDPETMLWTAGIASAKTWPLYDHLPKTATEVQWNPLSPSEAVLKWRSLLYPFWQQALQQNRLHSANGRDIQARLSLQGQGTSPMYWELSKFDAVSLNKGQLPLRSCRWNLNPATSSSPELSG